jgi:dolichol kinase
MHPNTWVFLAAMLHLGLADAGAALIGKRWGEKTAYKVFGQKKSLIGSLAFYIISFIITAILLQITSFGTASWLVLLLLPPLVTLGENVSIYGADNFVIPVLVVLVLSA